MKKNFLLLSLCSIFLLVFAGCSSEVAQADYNSLQIEKGAVEAKLKVLQDKYNSLDKKYSELSEEHEALQKNYKKYKKKMKAYEDMETAKASAKTPEAKTATKIQSAQDEATEAIRKVWDFENGVLADGATRELWNTAENKINALADETVKNSLIPALEASDTILSQMEQASAEAEAQKQALENASMEQKNALSKAKSYLDYTAFSYSGLIEQLEYEGFSAESAIYAADNCGADWNEQAASKAAKYLDYTSFSRQGLVEQLVYEGFTNEQADYGASAVGY